MMLSKGEEAGITVLLAVMFLIGCAAGGFVGVQGANRMWAQSAIRAGVGEYTIEPGGGERGFQWITLTGKDK